LLLSFISLLGLSSCSKDDEPDAKKTIIPVTGIGVSSSLDSVTLEIDKTVSLDYKISPIDATNQNVIFKSDNAAIASVNSDGKVVAVSIGAVVITVTTEDGAFSDSIEVKVIPKVIPITDVDIIFGAPNPSVEVGKEKIYDIDVIPDNATNQGTTWESLDPLIATVSFVPGNTAITVTGIAEGTARLKVTSVDGQFSDTQTVKVIPSLIPVSGISLLQVSEKIAKGQSSILTASITPVNASDKSLTWSSDNLSVATVDANGKVTAVSVGVAIIKATTKDGDFSDTTEVTVVLTNINKTSGKYNAPGGSMCEISVGGGGANSSSVVLGSAIGSSGAVSIKHIDSNEFFDLSDGDGNTAFTFPN